MSLQTGEKQAWGTLQDLNPEDVCNRAKVSFDKLSRLYTLKSFGQDIIISLSDEEIFSHSPAGDLLLQKLSYFSNLSILWYLINAKDAPLSGRLVNPDELKGGSIYSSGSHVLPLDKIAAKYGSDTKGFLKRGRELGGEEQDYGDAALMLFPFPRVPVTIILWASNDEFPARSSLLFDSTCESQLPLDILWSTAMMSVLIIL